MSSTDTRTVIVGAGPTGLLLAGDLAEAGVEVVLLERRPASDDNLTRAFAVHARTMEELDARGLADELIATGRQVRDLQLLGALRVSMEKLPTRFPFVLITPQYQVERLLERRALAAGARIVRGAEVVTLRQDADGVTLETAGGGEGGGSAETYRAAYVVGTDGVRSTVRRLIGMPFPGDTVLKSVILGDVRFADAPKEVLTVNANRHGLAFTVPFGDGYHRVIAWNSDPARQVSEDEPADPEELRQIMRSVLGTDFGMADARWTGRFHSDERQAPQYRAGRVLLAGDAAHVHSPAGGMGMNTGLQDAANLGWKLAAVLSGRVRGEAAEELLDSYQKERWPVGKAVLRTSGAIVRLALGVSHGGVLGAGRRLAVGGLLRTVGGVLPTRRGALRVSGVSFAYGGSADRKSLVGRRIPDLRLSGDRPRLYEALRGGRFVLVTADPSIAAAAGKPGDLLRVTAPAGSLPAGLLVRPDGYAAWSGTTPAGLREALARAGAAS
ncbi:FAD-dependent monooxygenase [Phaeacidiphilus oryzae]|uniref:FAD-dependent monooxygenase n=1 Tax=Phaeacidiphilus oryzae TaxID=348818 RepID=UPI0005694FCE|nr:FAD-dependent monooxygenase [Phaeacidiphilus oryzae]